MLPTQSINAAYVPPEEKKASKSKRKQFKSVSLPLKEIGQAERMKKKNNTILNPQYIKVLENIERSPFHQEKVNEYVEDVDKTQLVYSAMSQKNEERLRKTPTRKAIKLKTDLLTKMDDKVNSLTAKFARSHRKLLSMNNFSQSPDSKQLESLRGLSPATYRQSASIFEESKEEIENNNKNTTIMTSRAKLSSTQSMPKLPIAFSPQSSKSRKGGPQLSLRLDPLLKLNSTNEDFHLNDLETGAPSLIFSKDFQDTTQSIQSKKITLIPTTTEINFKINKLAISDIQPQQQQPPNSERLGSTLAGSTIIWSQKDLTEREKKSYIYLGKDYRKDIPSLANGILGSNMQLDDESKNFYLKSEVLYEASANDSKSLKKKLKLNQKEIAKNTKRFERLFEKKERIDEQGDVTSTMDHFKNQRYFKKHLVSKLVNAVMDKSHTLNNMYKEKEMKEMRELEIKNLNEDVVPEKNQDEEDDYDDPEAAYVTKLYDKIIKQNHKN